ncbi:Spx/MgsR family RNA polymerase-binding regulatory protein [Cyclobacterium jeungdonense]|uniref:Spx/MgsR family RNA polymerase-binding regulatory protein n=1 Tax=Cyclobacterium jeungdonense TaxID=708087 RepID=A0ABT8C8N9_9BACT|nr:Spx/MgsR family RNA polymerase-binding regulatory protein [Cyclobacterium jeungdonense]MDN3688125.1 Spx/MgsR family RNA polymerase-binding regulatory protein [Cyclobacterium jeungdonense]
MSTKIYGIKNCNTMKKTFALFEEAGKPYEFVDYKKQKPDSNLLRKFIDELGLEQVFNKRGTTFRKLDEEAKSAAENKTSAIPLLQEKSSMIKRPIIVFEDGSIQAGLDEEKIQAKF